MTKEINTLVEKIARTQRKLIKACLANDEKKMIKHQHKLLSLNLLMHKDD